jgi:hypothetical protein
MQIVKCKTKNDESAKNREPFFCHSRGSGNPGYSNSSGLLLEFIPYLIRGRSDKFSDFFQNHETWNLREKA